MKTLTDVSLKPKDRRAIEAAARLLRDRFPVERIVLYGSKATGADVEESDIDLLLLTSRTRLARARCDYRCTVRPRVGARGRHQYVGGAKRRVDCRALCGVADPR